jgi:hypothetical protein
MLPEPIEAGAQPADAAASESESDRLSMFPVDPKDALRAFMQVDPKKLRAAEAAAAKKRKKR